MAVTMQRKGRIMCTMNVLDCVKKPAILTKHPISTNVNASVDD